MSVSCSEGWWIWPFGVGLGLERKLFDDLFWQTGRSDESFIAIEILRMLSSLQCRGGVSSHDVILPGHWTCDVEITVPEP